MVHEQAFRITSITLHLYAPPGDELSNSVNFSPGNLSTQRK